jgi:hypothetical protein
VALVCFLAKVASTEGMATPKHYTPWIREHLSDAARAAVIVSADVALNGRTIGAMVAEHGIVKNITALARELRIQKASWVQKVHAVVREFVEDTENTGLEEHLDFVIPPEDNDGGSPAPEGGPQEAKTGDEMEEPNPELARAGGRNAGDHPAREEDDTLRQPENAAALARARLLVQAAAREQGHNSDVDGRQEDGHGVRNGGSTAHRSAHTAASRSSLRSQKVLALQTEVSALARRMASQEDTLRAILDAVTPRKRTVDLTTEAEDRQQPGQQKRGRTAAATTEAPPPAPVPNQAPGLAFQAASGGAGGHGPPGRPVRPDYTPATVSAFLLVEFPVNRRGFWILT